jgi:glutamine cyclotransferase
LYLQEQATNKLSLVPAAVAALCSQLEFIGGEVWANIWQSQCIARICPETGKVKGWLLMHGLRQSLLDRNLASNGMDVLNGEATQQGTKRR